MTDLQAVRYWAITLQVLQAIRAGRMTADAAVRHRERLCSALSIR